MPRGAERIVWLATLCAVLSGCTTYRPASVPGAESDVGVGDESARIAVGDVVRIALKSGETVSGKVTRITDEDVALGGRGNFGDEDVVIRVAAIDHAEVRDQSDGQIEGRWFIGLGVAALVGAYVSLRGVGSN